jgi:methyl-accepting chemotaxis protein
MREEPIGSANQALLGMALMVVVSLFGAAALMAATAYGAPSWLYDGFLVVAAILAVVYATIIFVPARGLHRQHAKAMRQAAALEALLGDTSGQLQSGDLVAMLRIAARLPHVLAEAFTAAAKALSALVQQIQNSSIEIAGSGNAVRATASELASGSSEQAAAVVEITATMEELARTAAQIAANAASQADLAARAEASGNSGASAVEEAVAGVEEVQKRISGIASRGDVLGTRSKEIYRVLDLITEIAQETHILSLNAAIEAAAAGEHGRRFSVVADEVRRLAQRSQESVESVRNLLDEFSSSIRATVVATEEGGKETSGVLVRARAAAGVIEELRGALSDTARTAKEISLATQQQRTASDQVVLTLKEVSQVIQRMAEGLNHFSGTAERLNQLALSIQLLTQSFHLDSPRSLKHLVSQFAGEFAARAGHWEAVEVSLEEIVKRNPFLEVAFLTDDHGALVSIAVNREATGGREGPGGVAVGANLADRPWFQSAARDRHSILTPLYDSLLTGQKCFTVAAPIVDAGDRFVGVFGLDVNAKGWTKI